MSLAAQPRVHPVHRQTGSLAGVVGGVTFDHHFRSRSASFDADVAAFPARVAAGASLSPASLPLRSISRPLNARETQVQRDSAAHDHSDDAHTKHNSDQRHRASGSLGLHKSPTHLPAAAQSRLLPTSHCHSRSLLESPPQLALHGSGSQFTTTPLPSLAHSAHSSSDAAMDGLVKSSSFGSPSSRALAGGVGGLSHAQPTSPRASYHASLEEKLTSPKWLLSGSRSHSPSLLPPLTLSPASDTRRILHTAAGTTIKTRSSLSPSTSFVDALHTLKSAVHASSGSGAGVVARAQINGASLHSPHTTPKIGYRGLTKIDPSVPTHRSSASSASSSATVSPKEGATHPITVESLRSPRRMMPPAIQLNQLTLVSASMPCSPNARPYITIAARRPTSQATSPIGEMNKVKETLVRDIVPTGRPQDDAFATHALLNALTAVTSQTLSPVASPADLPSPITPMSPVALIASPSVVARSALPVRAARFLPPPITLPVGIPDEESTPLTPESDDDEEEHASTGTTQPQPTPASQVSTRAPTRRGTCTAEAEIAHPDSTTPSGVQLTLQPILLLPTTDAPATTGARQHHRMESHLRRSREDDADFEQSLLADLHQAMSHCVDASRSSSTVASPTSGITLPPAIALAGSRDGTAPAFVIPPLSIDLVLPDAPRASFDTYARADHRGIDEEQHSLAATPAESDVASSASPERSPIIDISLAIEPAAAYAYDDDDVYDDGDDDDDQQDDAGDFWDAMDNGRMSLF